MLLLGKTLCLRCLYFLAYNKEIAVGFDDDPQRRFTDDVIGVAECLRDIFPDAVLFDQYNGEVW